MTVLAAFSKPNLAGSKIQVQLAGPEQIKAGPDNPAFLSA